MNTNSVVRTQWVVGICSTDKQASMLAEQDLNEIPTLFLFGKRQKIMKEKLRVFHV